MFIAFLTKSVRSIPSDHHPTGIVFYKPLSSVTRWFDIYTLEQCSNVVQINGNAMLHLALVNIQLDSKVTLQIIEHWG